MPMPTMPRRKFLLLASLLAMGVGPAVAAPPEAIVRFTTMPVTGIGKEAGVCRRDPSDVIDVRGKHYVWYTKVVKDAPLFPSGYHGSVWGAVSEDAGKSWRELGEAIPKGPAGAFDSTATFTPNILAWKGKFYLYYTAVGDDFDNGPYADRNRTVIGVAVADSPGGPWKKKPAPVLESTRDPSRFDSYRVDDSCLVPDGDRVLMFYKGRAWKKTPGQTKMGVAAADSPLGPFKRLNGGKPVQDGGHEVLVFRHGGKFWSLTSPHGPAGSRLLVTENPLAFSHWAARLDGRAPPAPGLFRPELTGHAPADHTRWGIAMATYKGAPYLQRFEFIVPGSR